MYESKIRTATLQHFQLSLLQSELFVLELLTNTKKPQACNLLTFYVN